MVFWGFLGLRSRTQSGELASDDITELQHPPLRSRCFRDLRADARAWLRSELRRGLLGPSRAKQFALFSAYPGTPCSVPMLYDKSHFTGK